MAAPRFSHQSSRASSATARSIATMKEPIQSSFNQRKQSRNAPIRAAIAPIFSSMLSSALVFCFTASVSFFQFSRGW